MESGNMELYCSLNKTAMEVYEADVPIGEFDFPMDTMTRRSGTITMNYDGLFMEEYNALQPIAPPPAPTIPEAVAPPTAAAIPAAIEDSAPAIPTAIEEGGTVFLCKGLFLFF